MHRRSVVAVALVLLFSMIACKKPPDLAHRVQDRIHAKLPAAKIEIQSPSIMEIGFGDDKVTINLDNLAAGCQNDPDRCDDNIDVLVTNLAQRGDPPKPVAADDLRVVLRSQETVEANRKAVVQQSPPDKLADNQLVTYPFLGDMMVVLVRDMPNGIALMNHGALVTLQLDDAKARDIGTANLEKHHKSLPTQPVAAGVFRVFADDNYEAARILVPKLWDSLAKQVKGDLLVVAPTRDVVYATGSGNELSVATMNALAKKAYAAGPYSLSLAVLRRTDAGFVLAPPPPP